MAKPKNSFETMARAAAKRLDKVRAEGEQLSLLPDEGGLTPAQAGSVSAGRPKGAKNKGSTQMREWLASKGYRMPEDVLAQMAGLAKSQDAMLTAMESAERALAWAYDGATAPTKGVGSKPIVPTASARLNTFLQFYAIQLRAADALLPYGAPKATPDVQVNQNTTVIVPMAPQAAHDPAAFARDVTPAKGGRMVPADVAFERQQNQEVSGSDLDNSDEDFRT
ncbi:hypothetical protein [Roseobacter sp. TSBP12]|uniref:hypothetical protein n=1 Tax=Roseobacter sp. TSBP12 TaxID=1236613 RepID=UPI00125F7345|nr:hypothetical protein [Roseobacter sp. TSBP12]KAB6717724.1 hypothetical protein C8029_04180 [Roseobacter sp. TSBP12]